MKLPEKGQKIRLPRWHSGKESTARAGVAKDMGPSSGLGRSLGVGNGNPL